jgi:acetyl-CoA carboxylase, biotin carboxylase subunit
LEESPSMGLNKTTRQRIGTQVVEALTKIGYSSAGTVEFLRDTDGSLYFIEMNARIQVEHPVTEMVTGVDLVKSQIRMAAGEKLADVVGHVEFRGNAIECRINAEDPETFVPSAGRVTAFRVPGGPGIRVDTACYADAVIPPYYDSLIAKIIAHGHDRAEAIARMQRALTGFVVEGVKTTIPLHRKILANPDFVAGKFDTHFLERVLSAESK